MTSIHAKKETVSFFLSFLSPKLNSLKCILYTLFYLYFLDYSCHHHGREIAFFASSPKGKTILYINIQLFMIHFFWNTSKTDGYSHFTHLLTRLLAYSLTHSFTYSFTHSFTHSLIHFCCTLLSLNIVVQVKL